MGHQPAKVTWPEVWAVVRQSVEKRLGKPLLRAYLFMTILAVLIVLASLIVMRWS